jgi:tRNA threonylcarbamoyladenosine biosynthesis protein TsaE
MEIVSKNQEETRNFAIKFASELKPKDQKALVIGLYGNLGAGKTTFMKYFAEALGVEQTIQSPTFVIMKFYKASPQPRGLGLPLSLLRRGEGGEVQLIHIDAYRLDSGDDLLKLGWEETISDQKNIVCIEWPDKVAEIMPEHIVLKFEHGDSENERKISIA